MYKWEYPCLRSSLYLIFRVIEVQYSPYGAAVIQVNMLEGLGLVIDVDALQACTYISLTKVKGSLNAAYYMYVTPCVCVSIFARLLTASPCRPL